MSVHDEALRTPQARPPASISNQVILREPHRGYLGFSLWRCFDEFTRILLCCITIFVSQLCFEYLKFDPLSPLPFPSSLRSLTPVGRILDRTVHGYSHENISNHQEGPDRLARDTTTIHHAIAAQGAGSLPLVACSSSRPLHQSPSLQ